jgi:SAM-dependent methyltransferase
LATAAHAALRVGAETLARVRFTVLDRCPTPLQLCREYAARHGLTLNTEALDLVPTNRVFPADIVVHHNMIRFLPADSQQAVLRKIGQWLKVGGHIVFSSSLNPNDGKEPPRANRVVMNELIRSLVEAGAIEVGEPRELFYARLDRHLEMVRPGSSRFTSADRVRELFLQAGLSILSLETASPTIPLANGQVVSRQRLLAIAWRHSGRIGRQ